MPQFSYSAFDPDGKTVTGQLSAENEVAALDQVARKGLIPIDLKEGGVALKWWQRELSLSGTTEIRPEVLSRFFQTFSIMLDARFPVTKSLSYCARQIRDPRLRRLLDAAHHQVQDGDPVAEALTDGYGSIPARYLRMIEVAEASNQLAQVIGRIAKGLDDELRIKREIRQALVYPVILILMSMLVIALLVFYLTPTLMPVFLSSQAAPPVVLSTMASIRQLVLQHWLILLVLAAAIGGLSYGLRGRLKVLIFKIAQHLPGLKVFLQKRQSLLFCQTMVQFLSSGDRLQSAVQQTQAAVPDPDWQELLKNAHDSIVDGKTLRASLNDTDLMDPLALAMIEAGEESDQLLETLQTAVNTLGDQTKQSLAQAVKLITPTLTLVIGLGVGAVIMSTISAILDLNDIAF
ncbi:Type II secretion system (T2SS), protein F [Aliiroseovarius halocynthiae]|nr:Type II secretion system (T2SS), protein F [Aliiroseovarius halocynthiae]